MSKKLRDLVKKSYSKVKDGLKKTGFTIKDTAKEVGLYAILSSPAWLPTLANSDDIDDNFENAFPSNNITYQQQKTRSKNNTSQAEQFQEANEIGFSEYTDILGKLNFDFRDGYNDTDAALKLSRDPIGLYVFGSNANQDTDFGNTNIKETGIDVGLYHPFEFDWGKINTGLKFGIRDEQFKDYPIEKIEKKKVGAYAKITGDEWKAFLRYNNTFDSSFEFGEEKDYNEDLLTLGFKKFIDVDDGKAYWGIDFDKYSENFEDIGDKTKRIISAYGGKVGGDVFDDMRIGIYAGNETNFDGSHEIITPGAEFRATKIINDFLAFNLKAGYQEDRKLYGGLGITGRFKHKNIGGR